MTLLLKIISDYLLSFYEYMSDVYLYSGFFAVNLHVKAWDILEVVVFCPD